MPKTEFIRFRVEPKIKEDFKYILDCYSTTPSELLQAFVESVVEADELPSRVLHAIKRMRSQQSKRVSK